MPWKVIFQFVLYIVHFISGSINLIPNILDSVEKSFQGPLVNKSLDYNFHMFSSGVKKCTSSRYMFNLEPRNRIWVSSSPSYIQQPKPNHNPSEGTSGSLHFMSFIVGPSQSCQQNLSPHLSWHTHTCHSDKSLHSITWARAFFVLRQAQTSVATSLMENCLSQCGSTSVTDGTLHSEPSMPSGTLFPM